MAALRMMAGSNSLLLVILAQVFIVSSSMATAANDNTTELNFEPMHPIRNQKVRFTCKGPKRRDGHMYYDFIIKKGNATFLSVRHYCLEHRQANLQPANKKVYTYCGKLVYEENRATELLNGKYRCIVKIYVFYPPPEHEETFVSDEKLFEVGNATPDISKFELRNVYNNKIVRDKDTVNAAGITLSVTCESGDSDPKPNITVSISGMRTRTNRSSSNRISFRELVPCRISVEYKCSVDNGFGVRKERIINVIVNCLQNRAELMIEPMNAVRGQTVVFKCVGPTPDPDHILYYKIERNGQLFHETAKSCGVEDPNTFLQFLPVNKRNTDCAALILRRHNVKANQLQGRYKCIVTADTIFSDVLIVRTKEKLLKIGDATPEITKFELRQVSNNQIVNDNGQVKSGTNLSIICETGNSNPKPNITVSITGMQTRSSISNVLLFHEVVPCRISVQYKCSVDNGFGVRKERIINVITQYGSGVLLDIKSISPTGSSSSTSAPLQLQLACILPMTRNDHEFILWVKYRIEKNGQLLDSYSDSCKNSHSLPKPDESMCDWNRRSCDKMYTQRVIRYSDCNDFFGVYKCLVEVTRTDNSVYKLESESRRLEMSYNFVSEKKNGTV